MKRISLGRELFPILHRVAAGDWTDSILARLAAERPPSEIEPYQVTARLSRIALHIARMQDDAFGRFDLNRGEVGVLGALLMAGANQRLSPTQLFRGLMLSSAGITSRLDRLERRGYVRRAPHPNDRRGVLVELTPAGRKVLEKAVGEDAGRERDLLAALTRPEQRELVALLRKLLASLEPVNGPA